MVKTTSGDSNRITISTNAAQNYSDNSHNIIISSEKKDSNNITITNNAAKYFSENAKAFANESKNYANMAKTFAHNSENYANMAKEAEEAAKELINGDVISLINDKVNSLESAIENYSWGSIQGNIEDQEDLFNAFAKSNELNSPYTFGMFQYTDVELSNLSWLKSTNVFQPKTVYPSLYNWVLTQYNQEKEGFKAVDDEYTNTDWVINTSDETFRTPLIASVNNALNKRFLVEKKEATSNDPTWYNWYSDGYIEQGGIINGSANRAFASFSKSCKNVNVTLGNIINESNSYATGYDIEEVIETGFYYHSWIAHTVYNIGKCYWYACGYGNIPTAEDITDNVNLYFYAGETVQNANLIDAGRLGEQLVTKTDMAQAAKAGMPSNRYIDLTLGANNSYYTAPANGYFSLSGKQTASGGWIHLSNNTAGFALRCQNSYNNTEHFCYIPVSKDNVVQLLYTNMTNLVLKFTYAEGET